MKRSENIGIVTTGNLSPSSSSPSSSYHLEQRRLYEIATWRMYHRITSARRKQQQQQQQLYSVPNVYCHPQQDQFKPMTHLCPPSIHQPIFVRATRTSNLSLSPPPPLTEEEDDDDYREFSFAVGTGAVVVHRPSVILYHVHQEKQYDGEMFIMDL